MTQKQCEYKKNFPATLIAIVILLLPGFSVSAAPPIMGLPGKGGDSPIFEPPPPVVIDSVTPGSSAPGGIIILTGSGFKSASIAAFRIVGFSGQRIETSGTVISDTELRVTVPDNLSCGLYDLYVHSLLKPTTIGSFSNYVDFTVSTPCTSVPLIGGLAPRAANKGQTVNVSGLNFVTNSTVTLQHIYPPLSPQPMATTVQSGTNLSFTVPSDIDCKRYTARVSTSGAIAQSNPHEFSVLCPPTANWQIQLSRLSAESVQEDSWLDDGDEPYLVAVGFRSRVLTPGSTTTFWGGYLNDDWADGIDVGKEADIPEQMGVLTYPDVTLMPLGCVVAITCYIEMQTIRPEFIGAVVFAIESDSMPFSSVRDRIEGRRAELLETVRQLVEEFYQNRPILELFDELDDPINLGGFGNWIGSFFNRDDYIGAQILMYAAVNADDRNQNSPFVLEQNIPISGFLPRNTSRILSEGNLSFTIGDDSPRYRITGSINATSRGFIGILPNASTTVKVE